ncbi:MAG: hypothetical protein HY094_00965 [Candidatus Melainabacteria bacterium]|nr:hypothetical protein [Candidatus Melainabacteria bacterium]
MLTDTVFSQGMVKLSNFFKKDDIPTMFLEDYYKAISELTDNQFVRAVEHLIKTHKSGFFPVPAQLLQAVEDSREQVQVTPQEMRIGTTGSSCPPPPEVKKFMEELKEKWKRRSMK